jgi:hypothetical protein
LGETQFKERLDAVEARIQGAAVRSGRARSAITLVAVTKKFSAEAMLVAYRAGLREFGENYVQEFAGKKPLLGEARGARYHLIGHLQSNKTGLAAELFDVVQTVDSPKLVRKLEAAGAERGRNFAALIEVKLSGEASKAGAAPEDIAAILKATEECPRVRLTGLMTIPPWSTDEETARPYFRRLAELARTYRLPDLSMGMSNDFEAAIEEGATLIRVGTALFGPRMSPAL